MKLMKRLSGFIAQFSRLGMVALRFLGASVFVMNLLLINSAHGKSSSGKASFPPALQKKAHQECVDEDPGEDYRECLNEFYEDYKDNSKNQGKGASAKKSKDDDDDDDDSDEKDSSDGGSNEGEGDSDGGSSSPSPSLF